MSNTLHTQHLHIDIFHAVEYCWPHWTRPYVAWPRQYALWLIEEGELEVRIGGQQWLLEKGQVFLAPMRQPRYLSAPGDGVRWWSLNFIPTWLFKIDPLQSLQQPLVMHNPPYVGDLREYMRLLAQRWMTPWHKGPLTPSLTDEYHSLLPFYKASFSRQDQIICQGLAQAAFGWCLEAMESRDIPLYLHQSIPPWLPQALALIEENPRISVDDLASSVSFSPAQLRRLFHQWLGTSPQDYLVTWRMDKAHYLLETTDWTVAAIARSLGFSSAPSFARIFRKVYGVAPAELRQAMVHDRN